MKNIGFMAVAGVVSVIVASFLPSPPGMQSWIVFVGTVAAIAGSALGIPAHKSPAGWKVLLVLLVLAAFVFGVVEFRSVLAGEPGKEAANMLLVWTATVFVPIGFLIELAGLKVTDQDKDS
jgi:hypothetical protein